MPRLCVGCGFFAAICVVFYPAFVFAETTPATPGYGAMLGQLVLVVVGVCGLAYVILRFGVKRFVSPQSSGMMEVVSRLPVEPRRSILVVRIGDRHMVVGTSEAGFTKLGELDEILEVEPEIADRPSAFAELLKQGRAS